MTWHLYFNLLFLLVTLLLDMMKMGDFQIAIKCPGQRRVSTEIVRYKKKLYTRANDSHS